MEITSFPFLSQEDISHFYSLFPEMDDFSVNNDSKKRQREEEEDNNYNKDESNKSTFDILTSLILLDEEEKREAEQKIVESQLDKAIFEANYKQKVQTMNDYRGNFKTHYSELEDLEHSRTKRARRSVSTVAATVGLAAISNNNGSDNPVQSGSGSVPPGQHRRLWVKNRSKDWWDMYNNPDVAEEEFKKAFRMSKSTFNLICEELDSVVTKKNTMLREAIPVRQRIAVCIWRLATGEPLRLVSKRFGLGISTCHKLVLEVCFAIRTVLMPKFLQWPNDQKMKIIKEEFESNSGISNVGGSMYTTHVPIIAPKISVSAYFNKKHTERNQKTSYSITVQGVVDPKGVFTDVCIGWPGSLPDDKVLEKSALYQRANRGLLKDVWIVGNCGYPLMDWVLVPYVHQNLTWTQHAFNEKVVDIQRVAKEAFARLKGRWSCLQKRTEVKLQDLPVVLGACCVLHNICEIRNEEIDPELKFEIFDDEMIPENIIMSFNAGHARDQIAHELLHHRFAETGFIL